jgi:hypothetical protein
VDGRVVSSDVVQTELIIVAFVGFTRMFLLGILIFKGLTARRLYKSFGVKGLMTKALNTVIIFPDILIHLCITENLQAQICMLGNISTAQAVLLTAG